MMRPVGPGFGGPGLAGGPGPLGTSGPSGFGGPLGPGLLGTSGPSGFGGPLGPGPIGPSGPSGFGGPLGPGPIGPSGPSGFGGPLGPGPIRPSGPSGFDGPLGPLGPGPIRSVGPGGPIGPNGTASSTAPGGPGGPAGGAVGPGVPTSAPLSQGNQFYQGTDPQDPPDYIKPDRLYVGYKNFHTTYIYLDPKDGEKQLRSKIESFLWRNFSVKTHGEQYYFYFVDRNGSHVEVPSGTVKEAFDKAKGSFVGKDTVYLYAWPTHIQNDTSNSNSTANSNKFNSCSNKNNNIAPPDVAPKTEFDLNDFA